MTSSGASTEAPGGIQLGGSADPPELPAPDDLFGSSGGSIPGSSSEMPADALLAVAIDMSDASDECELFAEGASTHD